MWVFFLNKISDLRARISPLCLAWVYTELGESIFQLKKFISVFCELTRRTFLYLSWYLYFSFSEQLWVSNSRFKAFWWFWWYLFRKFIFKIFPFQSAAKSIRSISQNFDYLEIHCSKWIYFFFVSEKVQWSMTLQYSKKLQQKTNVNFQIWKVDIPFLLFSNIFGSTMLQEETLRHLAS